ncbi:MAG: N-6 DNA methylase [Pirellulales bacterium]|nr:N-6 DNA methylase [Pirellulales bacterium]
MTDCNLSDCDLPADSAPPGVATERGLAAVAVALGASRVRGWSPQEQRLAGNLPAADRRIVDEMRQRIHRGEDPLGELFCRIRSPQTRRRRGATFTPRGIVQAMVDWAGQLGSPIRVVDPGTGSGRFLIAAAKRFPDASLVGMEVDPLAAVLARANLAVLGLADRAELILGDYRGVGLARTPGRTLFVGNPPYVRHHLIGPRWKQWLVTEAARHGLPASRLAGLHAHFYLATVSHAAPGDFGTLITAAEWLDVNYGELVRRLFLGPLGGRGIVILEPTARPFPDAAVTGAITQFEIGSRCEFVRLKRVKVAEGFHAQHGEQAVSREHLQRQRRWSGLARPPRKVPAGYVELGEICRVHRGQVTGANKFWIEGPHSEGLPQCVFYATVTRARELFHAGKVLSDASALRRVIDLPVDLSGFDRSQRSVIARFLRHARALGVPLGYVACNRRAWWSVGLHRPAPILATYMARRPPAFVLNHAAARHLNIAHGIYPRERLGRRVLRRLVACLCEAAQTADGRTYAGGLTKFEPREMERIRVPGPELLRQFNDRLARECAS